MLGSSKTPDYRCALSDSRYQRSLSVQRLASRDVTFAIMPAKASSRSMCCELAMQMTTNRISASSSASDPSLLAEPVVDLAREFADLLGEPGEVRERGEISPAILVDPAIHRLLDFVQTHGRLQRR